MNEEHAVSKNKIVIRMDPEIQDLIPEFLENRKKDIAVIPQALGKSDFESIRTIGHGMKGAGSGYGFEGITDIGNAMETAALAKDKDGIQKQLNALIHYLDCLEIVYDGSGS